MKTINRVKKIKPKISTCIKRKKIENRKHENQWKIY